MIRSRLVGSWSGFVALIAFSAANRRRPPDQVWGQAFAGKCSRADGSGRQRERFVAAPRGLCPAVAPRVPVRVRGGVAGPVDGLRHGDEMGPQLASERRQLRARLAVEQRSAELALER